MTSQDAAPQDRPGLAIGLYLLAMVMFVAMDGLSKSLTTGGMAPEYVTSMRYLLVMTLLAPAVAWQWRTRPFRTGRPVLQIARGVLLIGSATIFVYALRSLPLETATAIGFISPMFVTALSVIFLREKVGVRRWSAVGVGFIGVLAILRPGTADFQRALLLPIMSSLCWAGGLIITRSMRGRERPFTVLLWSTLAGFAVIAPFGLAQWQAPTWPQLGMLLLIAVCHVGGQFLTIRAFMLAAASALAPFSYTTLVWATLIGLFAFGSLPDLPTAVGASILAAAGLYVWRRERIVTGQATTPGASIVALQPHVRAREDIH